jgi:signal transduction histidine kinase
VVLEQPSPGLVLWYVAPPVATVLLSLVLLGWLWQTKRDVRGVRTFALVVVTGGAIWPSLTAVHVLTTNVPVQTFIVTAEKFVGFVASALWAVFISQYTNANFHRRRWAQALLALTISGFALAWLTNPVHRLLITDVEHFATPFSFSGAVRGPVYFLLLVVLYAFVSLGLYHVARFLLAARRRAGLRIALVGLGAMSVATLNLASILQLGPISEFQYGSYGAFPFLLFTAIAVFRLRLFDIAPVARTELVESLTDPVIVVDNDGHIADYNRQATALWAELPECVGDPLSAACPELAAELTVPPTADHTATQFTLPGDDRYRHYSMRVSAVGGEDEDGTDAIGYAILLRDVTELEESRQQLEQQNERLDRVASTVSHDLRNPLNVSSGYLELVREELTARNEDELVAYLENVEDAHGRMDTIIDDVLTLARDGQTVAEPVAVDLSTVAHEAWETVETTDATLVVEQDGTLWTDRSRLRTIFENLFRNAVEHGTATATDGGTGGLTVTVTAFADDGDDTDAGFSVADDGAGIPEDARDQLFEYGFSTSDEGTGLGLAIVETMAESQGWTVTHDGEYEDGTRFVFSDVYLSPSKTAQPGSSESDGA